MIGTWHGAEMPTDHPLDGMLAASGWWGKQFVDAETVHPLLFPTADGSALWALNPALAFGGLGVAASIPRAQEAGLLRVHRGARAVLGTTRAQSAAAHDPLPRRRHRHHGLRPAADQRRVPLLDDAPDRCSAPWICAVDPAVLLRARGATTRCGVSVSRGRQYGSTSFVTSPTSGRMLSASGSLVLRPGHDRQHSTSTVRPVGDADVVGAAVVTAAGLVGAGPPGRQARAQARGLIAAHPVLELSRLRGRQDVAGQQGRYPPPSARGVLVSRGSPGTAEFSSVSHRSSRVRSSPMRAREVGDRGRPADGLQQPVSRGVVAALQRRLTQFARASWSARRVVSVIGEFATQVSSFDGDRVGQVPARRARSFCSTRAAA